VPAECTPAIPATSGERACNALQVLARMSRTTRPSALMFKITLLAESLKPWHAMGPILTDQ
jgi:hypothetical protein